MNILLVSQNEDIYHMTNNTSIPGVESMTINHYVPDQVGTIRKRDYDLAVIDFNHDQLMDSNFKIVFDIKQKVQGPLLALYEKATTRDKLNLFNFGIEDYLDKPFEEETYGVMLQRLIRQKRIMDLIVS